MGGPDDHREPGSGFVRDLVVDAGLAERIGSLEQPRSLWTDDLHSEEAALVTGATAEPRAAFAAGRACARAALERVGAQPGALLRGVTGQPVVDRAPVWPAGYVASISHTATHCAAIAAREADFMALGLDVELPSRVTAKILDRICTVRERARAAEEGAEAAVHFSAKEAFYKAWSPLMRCTIGFRDVEVTLDRGGRFELQVVGDVDAGPFGRDGIPGHWRLEGDLVAVVLAIARR